MIIGVLSGCKTLKRALGIIFILFFKKPKVVAILY